MVWYLFHYQKPSLDYDEKNYASYKRVNQLYAQTLLKANCEAACC
jgi:trehalose-6-phosphate synthase